MSDLVAWLTKILDEDEAIAGNDLTPGPWTVQYECPEGEHHHDWDEVWVAGRMRSTVGGFNERYTCGPRDAAHVVRWQPTAVLADIAAKRAIIDEYVARDKDADLMLGPDCLRQQEWSGLRLAVQIIATGYATRPGYRDEWKPMSSRVHP